MQDNQSYRLNRNLLALNYTFTRGKKCHTILANEDPKYHKKKSTTDYPQTIVLIESDSE